MHAAFMAALSPPASMSEGSDMRLTSMSASGEPCVFPGYTRQRHGYRDVIAGTSVAGVTSHNAGPRSQRAHERTRGSHASHRRNIRPSLLTYGQNSGYVQVNWRRRRCHSVATFRDAPRELH